VAPATPWDCRGPGAKTAGGRVVRNALIAVLEWLAIWNCRALALTPLTCLRASALAEKVPTSGQGPGKDERQGRKCRRGWAAAAAGWHAQ
jgi:hypothetical protein